MGLAGIQMRVTPDPDAPFDRPPELSDFQWEDGETREFEGDPVKGEDGSWRVRFLVDTARVKVTATLPATVSNDVKRGAVLRASGKVKAGLEPDEAWPKNDGIVDFDEGTCVGTFVGEATYEADGYGTWLVEARWGADSPQVRFSDSKPKLRVRDSAGRDITDEVLLESDFRPNDSDEPLETGDRSSADGADDVSWRQSLNWKFDEETHTGATWLGSGTTIHFEQSYHIEDCSAGYDEHNVHWRLVHWAGWRFASAEDEVSIKFPWHSLHGAGLVVVLVGIGLVVVSVCALIWRRRRKTITG